jgi:hypothetical protein
MLSLTPTLLKDSHIPQKTKRECEKDAVEPDRGDPSQGRLSVEDRPTVHGSGCGNDHDQGEQN